MISNGNGRQDDTIRTFEREIVVSPKDIELRLSLARYCTRAERLPEAEAAYREAISLVGQDPRRYIEIVTEAQDSGLGWLGQPIPDYAEYVIGPASQTYAMEVGSVQRAKSAVYQPTIILPNGKRVKRLLTFEENIRARVEDFNTLTDEQGNQRRIEQRLALFRKWLSSCTGVAYKAGSTKFKIVHINDPMAYKLIDIPEGFHYHFIELGENEYEQIDGIELDRNEDIYSFRRNYMPLTSVDQVLDHNGWKAAVPDKKLLKAHAEIYFSQKESGMVFWVIENSEQDQLRALVLNLLDFDSLALANWSLGDSAQSLRVSPK